MQREVWTMVDGLWSRRPVFAVLSVVLVSGCARVTPPPRPSISHASTPPLPPPAFHIVFVEPFDQLDLHRWKEIELTGKTSYTIADQDESSCLYASSHGGASLLLTPLRFDSHLSGWLSWRWRVDRLVAEEDLTRKEGSDAAARVDVYFDTPGLPWQKRSLDDVWSATLPVRTILSRPFSKQAKILVVESGLAHIGQWQTVSRNLAEDYHRCFGQAPPDVVAIGLMTNADNTRTEAAAYYDEPVIARAPPTSPTRFE